MDGSAAETREQGSDGEAVQAELLLSGERFTELVERQVELYGHLEKLVEKQRELVSLDDPKPLLSLLAERQKLTEALSAVARQIGPLSVQWDRVREQLSPSRRSHCEAMLRRVRQYLHDIIAADGQDVLRLEVRKKNVVDELSGLATRGAMLSAYGQRTGVPATMDRTDESL